MKKLAFAFTSLLVFACAKEETYNIKGEAQGFAEGTKIFLQELQENNKRVAIDTAIVTAGTFTFSKPEDKGSGLQIITTDGSNGQLLFVKDDAPLRVTLYKDSIQSSIVTGSQENDLFYTYRTENRLRNTKKSKLLQEMRQAQAETDGERVNELSAQVKELDEIFITEKKNLLDENSDKMVAILALSDLINAKVLKVEETEAYYNNLSDPIKNSPVGESVKKYIAQQKSQRIAARLADVGNKAPEFSAATPEGEQLALSQTLGKYTIIDFWASWCRPCRMENPNVVRVYNKYHNKGLNIISVSLDRKGQDQRWKQAIEKDQMDWYHVSNLNYWDDPIARSYGVRSIPATFLLDENGIIIAKNLRGPALEAKMQELLGS